MDATVPLPCHTVSHRVTPCQTRGSAVDGHSLNVGPLDNVDLRPRQIDDPTSVPHPPTHHLTPVSRLPARPPVYSPTHPPIHPPTHPPTGCRLGSRSTWAVASASLQSCPRTASCLCPSRTRPSPESQQCRQPHCEAGNTKSCNAARPGGGDQSDSGAPRPPPYPTPQAARSRQRPTAAPSASTAGSTPPRPRPPR